MCCLARNLGKGEKPRQVLLPDIVSRSLLTLRGDAGANDPVFAAAMPGRRSPGNSFQFAVSVPLLGTVNDAPLDIGHLAGVGFYLFEQNARMRRCATFLLAPIFVIAS
jgi:hypothetical protein